MFCVGNDDDLRESSLPAEQGILRGIRSGAVIIDHTTASCRGRPGICSMRCEPRVVGFS